MPDSLKELLADERVLKCGVSIAHDAELLLAQYSLPVRGFVDLAAVSHRTGHTNSGLGLQPIVRAVLGADLSKEVAVQCSDWSADLTEEQIAGSGVRLMLGVCSRKKNVQELMTASREHRL